MAFAVVVWGGEDERGRRMGNKGSFWKKKKKKLSLLRVRLCRRAKAHMADEKQREDIATPSEFPRDRRRKFDLFACKQAPVRFIKVEF